MIKPSSCLAIGLVLTAIACHQPQSTANGSSAGSPAIAGSLAAAVQGSYQGHYSKGLLTLVINYISGNIASGYDFHKGLRRNLNGQVTQKGGQLVFEMKEPGGNPYDGTFFLNLDTASGKITGKWVPVDNTKAKEGPLTLSKMINNGRAWNGDDYMPTEWRGTLGELSLLDDGTCRLEYYPSEDDKSQLVTVKGNFEIKNDTIRIDWQRNSRTPTVNMKLVYHRYVESTDSTDGSPFKLTGNGLEFTERPG
jgi:hypothetical protein